MSLLTSKSEMASVKESFVLDWSWFHLPQRTVHTWVTWLPILHIPSWAHWAWVYVCVRAHMCAHMCVFVDSEWGLFRGFTAAPSGCVCLRRNSGMCSSNKREREERKKGEDGSASISWGGSGRTLPDVGWFLNSWPWNSSCMCVCIYIITTVNQWAFGWTVSGLLVSR